MYYTYQTYDTVAGETEWKYTILAKSVKVGDDEQFKIIEAGLGSGSPKSDVKRVIETE